MLQTFKQSDTAELIMTNNERLRIGQSEQILRFIKVLRQLTIGGYTVNYDKSRRLSATKGMSRIAELQGDND